MDEIAELRDALDRLHAAMDDLVVRGVRAAGPQEVTRLTALRDEFRTAGAEHLAEKLTTLVDTIQSGERSAAAALMRAVTTFRLFDRMLTLEFARAALAEPTPGMGEEAEEAEEDEAEEDE
jgi:precorrin isomerase